jgi:hypothetical protein
MTVPTLDDVKAHLNITSAIGDAELQGVLDAAVNVVEGMVGAIAPVQYTETYAGGTMSFFVSHPPLLSVQSMTEYFGNGSTPLTLEPLGTTGDAYGYVVEDAEWGEISRRATAWFPNQSGSYQMWSRFGSTVVIAYTAGRATVPPAIRLAILVVAAELWQTQRGTAALPAPGAVFPAQPGGGGDWTGGASIPALARQLCQGSGLMRTPGIA